MSLKFKLYAGFIVMIGIAMAMSGLAMRAFSVTRGHVEATSVASDVTANECTPVNAQANALALKIVEAGTGYYAYTFNHGTHRRQHTRDRGIQQSP